MPSSRVRRAAEQPRALTQGSCGGKRRHRAAAQPRTLNMRLDGQRAFAGPQQQRVLRRDGELVPQRRQIARPPVDLRGREIIMKEAGTCGGVAGTTERCMAQGFTRTGVCMAPQAGLEGGRRA